MKPRRCGHATPRYSAAMSLMAAVGYQAEGIDTQGAPLQERSDNFQGMPPVVVLYERRHPGHSPRDDVVVSPAKLDSNCSTHLAMRSVQRNRRQANLASSEKVRLPSTLVPRSVAIPRRHVQISALRRER